MRFQRNEDGLLIYSVGPDRNDDGGTFSLDGKPGTDIGIHLRNPDRRARPAR